MTEPENNKDFLINYAERYKKGIQKIHTTVARVFSVQGNSENEDQVFETEIENFEKIFREAMDDDFNSPRAIAATFDFIKKVNPWIDDKNISIPTLEKLSEIFSGLFDNVLGLLPQKFENTSVSSSDHLDGVMELVISLRAQLRQEKNWTLADEIRDKLTALGITLKDSPDGTSWEV